jgi:hypothetical protein
MTPQTKETKNECKDCVKDCVFRAYNRTVGCYSKQRKLNIHSHLDSKGEQTPEANPEGIAGRISPIVSSDLVHAAVGNGQKEQRLQKVLGEPKIWTDERIGALMGKVFCKTFLFNFTIIWITEILIFMKLTKVI